MLPRLSRALVSTSIKIVEKNTKKLSPSLQVNPTSNLFAAFRSVSTECTNHNSVSVLNEFRKTDDGVNRITIFRKAVSQQDVESVDLLLSAGASPSSALYEAIKSGNPLTIHKLFDAGANINMQDSENGNTILHKAVLDKNTNMLNSILERPGIRINIKNNDKQTARELAKHIGFEKEFDRSLRRNVID